MDNATSPGMAIFLNGTSSAGKTTLAYALQGQLEQPFLHIALDQFRDGMPARFRGLNSPSGSTGTQGLNVVPVIDEGIHYTRIEFGKMGLTMLRGMRRAMATMLSAGNNIIIDDIVMEKEFLMDYLSVFNGLKLYFVGVRCPYPVIEKRESNRPGRFPGTAYGQMNICHSHNIYDVQVNTAEHSPGACALMVIERIRKGPPEAFRLLREQAG
ncbi:MAG: hypothetical protein OXC84_12745 [Gammaproteobacteria bacterium]|nr:hypothetical protein [Gammaproteobacteria bacterium]